MHLVCWIHLQFNTKAYLFYCIGEILGSDMWVVAMHISECGKQDSVSNNIETLHHGEKLLNLINIFIVKI